MRFASENNTECAWRRKGIRDIEPDKNTDTIIDRIRDIDVSGMSVKDIADIYKINLASWRRFYKQSDAVKEDVQVTEANLTCVRLQSMNIVFYIMERKNRPPEIRAGISDFSDDIKSDSKELSLLHKP